LKKGNEVLLYALIKSWKYDCFNGNFLNIQQFNNYFKGKSMDIQLAAFNILYDYSKGTLWKVREDLWQESKLNYDQNSKRKWHPGLSVKENKMITSCESIPVLHGTSKGNPEKSVVVTGITSERSNDEKTYFGRILAPLNMYDFISNERSNRLVVESLEVRRIESNSNKLKINKEEMEQLENWLVRKGLKSYVRK
jgi:hypothetical protein